MFSRKPCLTTTELVKQTVPMETLVSRQRYFAKEYPTHVPAFVQFNSNSIIHRYVLPRDSTFAHFMIAFRRKIQLKSSESLMPLVEKEEIGTQTIKCFQATTGRTVGDIAKEYIHSDGYLYINMTLQNTFG